MNGLTGKNRSDRQRKKSVNQIYIKSRTWTFVYTFDWLQKSSFKQLSLDYNCKKYCDLRTSLCRSHSLCQCNSESIPQRELPIGYTLACRTTGGRSFYCGNAKNYRNTKIPSNRTSQPTPCLLQLLTQNVCVLTRLYPHDVATEAWPLKLSNWTIRCDFTVCTFVSFDLIWWYYFQGTIFLLLIPWYS